MLWNTLLLALRSIRRNLLRSFLTVLGIVIGVAAVITMVTLGNGATQAIADQVASLGSNLLIVRPGQRLGPGSASAGAPNFKQADAEAIQSQIGAVRAVAPTVARGMTVVAGARNWSTSVTGSTSAWFDTGNWLLAEGRYFNPAEERGGAAVCVIGETLRRELFGGQSPLGQPIRLKTFSCEVIGLLEAKGQSAFGSDQDDVLVLPLKTMQRRITGKQDITQLRISIKDEAGIDQAKKQVMLLMRERRKIADNEDDNFSVLDTRQITETLSGTTQVMTTLLGAVAAVSLLVGGIGIMNIMLVSVTERTREIGIRLAIGALEREVLLQFLIEAVVLSSMGGLTGVVLATGASIGLAGLMQVPYLFDPGINLLAFAFSAAIGVVFGFFPARRAARLDPIDALRHE
ncbi:MAG: ABC transporter permease [Pseudomonadota bacterium]